MKNHNFVRFFFGKERCHLQSEVKKNYVMALKVAPKVILKVYIHESGHFRSLRISDYQNIPLSYKIRLNQVCHANKIHS